MIKIRGLEKSFRKLKVLKGIQLEIEPGVTAIIGPNGSGKTTLIKTILGLVNPDRAEISVDGEEVGRRWDYKKKIGYMPQIASFPDNLKVEELLTMIRDLRNDPEKVDETLIDAFDLDREMDRPLRTLSGGTRQKVSAVLAFLFDPQILILDEPTAGLDPLASSRLKDKIIQEREKRKTIILTSHLMSELEELSQKIVFLLEGKIHSQGTVEELKEQTGERNLERAIAQIMKGSPLWMVPLKY